MHHSLCWWLALLLGTALGNEAGFCLQGAQNLPATDVQLTMGGQSMPPIQPALAAHDWDLAHKASEARVTSQYKRCHAEAPIYRYKVVNRAVYVDHDHHADNSYKAYRMTFLEQLTLSMWLYKDFPDVDLVVDFTDHPQLCDQDIPFLRYTIFNSSLLPAGQQYNITDLLAPAWISPSYAAKVTQYTRGFTIPSPEAWRDLSLTPAQLADFTSCMNTTHPWHTKQRKAFWRGQATGCSRGWPQQAAAAGFGPAATPPQGSAQQPGPAPHLLRNKRVQLALRLFPYSPQLADVGITSLPVLTPECLGAAQGQGHGDAQHHRQQQPVGMPARRGRHRVRRAHLRQSVGQRGLQGVLLDSASSAQQKQQEGWQKPSAEEDMSAARQLAALLHRHSMAQPVAGGQADAMTVDAGAELGPGGGLGQVPPVRAYRAVASMLRKEGLGLEGWADAALTLSIDGYGPPFRLPQQLLLGSAVLRMTSPYQTWLDWDLQPGVHVAEFAYDLSNLEQRVMQSLGGVPHSRTAEVGQGQQYHGSNLQAMSDAAERLLLARLHLVAQLDAFAWSVARYKQVCPWRVVAPAADDTTWVQLQLDAGVFTSKGVPQNVQLQVMQHVRGTFAAALSHPGLQSGHG